MDDESTIGQAHPAALRFQEGIPLLRAAVTSARLCEANGGPPISVQLDHATREEEVWAALQAGVDSVMIDGSAMAYADNVAWTSRVAAMARSSGAAVEAELGRLAGEEDGLSVTEVESRMTNPEQVPDFLTKTGADILAVTIGNVHGAYARPDPTLDLERLDQIRLSSSLDRGASPLLALHGASGLPPGMVAASILGGVCKLNVNTEVRQAGVRALKTALHGGKDLLDLLGVSTRAMRAVAEEKMLEFDPRSPQ
ncbi:unnamed protein product [Choristocarpus tenellus]